MIKFLLVCCLLFTGCTTAYGPNTLGGGYKDKKIDDNTYIVSFFGNGYTSEQQVWNYWMYRCAELTLLNGYTLFSLNPSDKHAFFSGENPVEFSFLIDMNEEEFRPVQYYYTTVTTYSSKAIVKMYNPPVEEKNMRLMDAGVVKEVLQPYIDAKAKIESPNRQALILRAIIEGQIKAQQLDSEEAEKIRNTLKEV